MKYKNTKTQAVIETACVIRGGKWIEVKEQPKSKTAKVKQGKEEK